MVDCSRRWKVLIQRRLERALLHLPDALLPQVSAVIQDFETAASRSAVHVSPESLGPVADSVGNLEMASYSDLGFADVEGWRITYAIEERQGVILLVDISPLRRSQGGRIV